MPDKEAISISVLLFARARELVGASSVTVSLDTPATTQALLERLLAEHPALVPLLPHCLLAVNQEYVERDAAKQVSPGDEVAVIPPISGG